MVLFRNRRARRGAFSLVEIVLALGIISFALMAILGLVSMSLGAGRAAADDTLVASMAREVVDTMRAMPFDELAEKAPTAAQPAYFDADGTLVTTAAKALYQCQVEPLPNSTPDLDKTLYHFRLVFTWPVGSKSPSRSTLLSSIARYE